MAASGAATMPWAKMGTTLDAVQTPAGGAMLKYRAGETDEPVQTPAGAVTTDEATGTGATD